MVDIVSEVTYPLDPTGQAGTNKIGPERHTLTSKRWSEFNILIPNAAPFFELNDVGKALKLTHYPSGRVLDFGKDWVPGWYFHSASARIGKHIYGCIVMIDPTMGGEIEIENYQTLGGEWTLNQQKLKELLADKLENPLRRYWEVIMNLPSIFPPLDHPHPVDDLSGLPQVLQVISGISEAILTASTGGGLPEHLLDFNNPHRTTKDHVQLGKVMNWAIATLTDIQVGSMNGETYMNPIMTYEMIRNVALTVLTAHINAQGNVHNTTAAQVGAYSKEEIVTLLNQLLRGELGSINANTLGNDTREQVLERARQTAADLVAAHANKTGNVHNAKAADFDAYTKAETQEELRRLLRGQYGNIDANTLEGNTQAEILTKASQSANTAINAARQAIINELSSIVAQMQAQDTQRFAGKTEQDWRLIISQSVDNAGNLMFHDKIVATPANPETGEPAWPRTSPTYTLLATIQAAWNGNYKRDVTTFEIAGGAAEADNSLLVFQGMVNPDQPTAMVIEHISGNAAGVSFVYRVNTQPTLPDGSANPRYNLGELWVKSPVKRRAITVTCNSQESFQISDGGEFVDQEDWVATPSDVIVLISNRRKAVDDAFAANTAAHQAFDTKFANVDQSLTLHGNSLSNLSQTVGLQGTAINGLTRREGLMVSEAMTMTAGQSRNFDLAALVNAAYGADSVTAYDLECPIIVARMVDDEELSPTNGRFVDATAVLEISNTAAGAIYFTNTANKQLVFNVRVWVRRKAF